jgi:hypothetical protein
MQFVDLRIYSYLNFSLPTDIAIFSSCTVRCVPTTCLPRFANKLFVQPVHTNVACISNVSFVFSNFLFALTTLYRCPALEVDMQNADAQPA